WSITLTPIQYFSKTVSEIQTAGFWMKLKDKIGKIETATFSVPFTDANVDATSISISGNDITSLGATSQLSVVYTPSNATPRTINWSVDDSSIATISSTGLLTPKKNGVVTVSASFLQNTQTISASKQITISNQISELYLIGSATQAGTSAANALTLTKVMGTTTDYVTGLFEINTTLSAAGTLQFISSKTDQNPLVYGMGASAGTIAQNGTEITPAVSGEVLIRVNLATSTYKIYPINPLRISQMGSSVSFGWGATNNQGYAYRYNQLLAQRFTSNLGANWSISNISIGGNATPDLLNRWESDLLNDNSKYVVYALSLGNEGIIGGGQPKFDQFKNNMQLLINKARAAGKIPIVANCYANGGYTSVEYNYVNQMNQLIHQWDVPSYNFLGADDDETGKWVTGYVMDAAHPNTDGHIEFFLTIVPSLFDALAAGKPQPVKQNGNSWLSVGTSVTTDNFKITPENTLHSFTQVIDVRTTTTGAIATFTSNNAQGVLRIEANGMLSYTSPSGTTITSSTAVNDGQWHKITLTHYYALGK
ncbi:MAG: GDSL-type esterase/lipase family protein, partial [Paludibacter sp.]